MPLVQHRWSDAADHDSCGDMSICRTRLISAASCLVFATLTFGCPARIVVTPPDSLPETTRDARTEFDAAVELYESGRFAEATSAFQIYIAMRPGDALATNAELYVARCLVAQGDEAGSARVLDGLLAAPDSAETRRSAAFYRAYVHA
ncbi:MAG: TolA-binding protein, partial [Bradymonadia bacterium]